MIATINSDIYKLVQGDEDTVLFITDNFKAEFKNKVILSFKNAPFNIALRNEGNLDLLQTLKRLIVVINDKHGEPNDILELDIKDVNYE